MPRNNGTDGKRISRGDVIERFSIYWFDPEPTVGSELRKVRPCVVISPEPMNRVLKTILIAPVTLSPKSWPWRIAVVINNRPSWVACDQLRAIDRARLKGYITTLASDDAQVIQQILQEIFG